MRILLIHTGGTIGMVPTPEGYAPQANLVERAVTGLTSDCDLDVCVDIVTANPLIDSASATPNEWNWLSDKICAHHDDYDAFVITHGTDTMAFTAAALCFALEGLRKPVILTGAMVPLSVEGSDGLRNLKDALSAPQIVKKGVWVQFAGRLLHGARVRKSHSIAYDAFTARPSHMPPWRPGTQLIQHRYSLFDVPILAVAPGMSEAVLQTSAEVADGIVLRCYGSGTHPSLVAFADALQTAMARAIPVLAVSQCADGGVQLGKYAAGAVLETHGVIDGRDLSTEAAYVKVLHSLSSRAQGLDLSGMLGEPICGEFGPV